jgi:hypothetical protein
MAGRAAQHENPNMRGNWGILRIDADAGLVACHHGTVIVTCGSCNFAGIGSSPKNLSRLSITLKRF